MKNSFGVPVKKTAILAIISAITLFIIFKVSVNAGTFLSVLSDIEMKFFWLAFATIPPTLILNGVRWHWVLRSAGFSTSLQKIIFIVNSGISLSILPGRLGDFARSYPLRGEISPAKAIGTIILEKIVDISVLLCYSGIGFFILGKPVPGVLIMALSVLIIPLLYPLHRLGKRFGSGNIILAKINEAFEIIILIKQRKRKFAIAYVSSFANWSLSLLQIYFLYQAVHSPISGAYILTFLPLSIFIGLIPVTLAGVGTRDAALIYFFSSLVQPSRSLAVGILYGVQSYWLPALLGIPFLRYFFKDR